MEMLSKMRMVRSSSTSDQIKPTSPLCGELSTKQKINLSTLSVGSWDLKRVPLRLALENQRSKYVIVLRKAYFRVRAD